jgi:hypothetical protein
MFRSYAAILPRAGLAPLLSRRTELLAAPRLHFHSLIKKRRPRRGKERAGRGEERAGRGEECAGRRPSPAGPDVNEVEVHDDFFELAVQLEIQRLLERPKWSFTGGRAANRFWHMDGLEAEPYFREHLFALICERIPGLKTFAIERIYANGQTALQSGEPHIDDGDVTLLYFSNATWKLAWNGSLLFLSDDEQEVARVVPYAPNRAVVFPAAVPHYADAPSKIFAGLRVSLAFKLRNTAHPDS